jgi:hypothetical protein
MLERARARAGGRETNDSYEGEAPLRIARQTGGGYWSLQSTWQARKTGLGGP